MSQTTRNLITALKAMIIPSSITPTTVGDIFTAVEDDIDNQKTSLDGDITALGTRITTAEGNITSHGSRLTTAEGNINSHTQSIQNINSTLTTHGSSITAQGNSITALQQKTLTTTDPITGPSTLQRVHDCVPLYVDDIDTNKNHYAKQIVHLKTANNIHVDLSKVDFEEIEILIDCSTSYDIEPNLVSANIKYRQGASFKMVAGNSYRLSLFRILDTTQHQTYSASDVDFYAILIKL